MKQWYEELFENYGEKYDGEPFVQGTAGECDFLESELNYDKSLKVLDIGCGTGRHAIELTKRGYTVVGVDLSAAQLARARKKAKEEHLHIDFLQGDARRLAFTEEFDAAIMLCEGGFSLMETDEMNFEILKGAARALKKPGKFIFTTLNGLFALYHSVEKFCAAMEKEGQSTYRGNTFDLMTFRDFGVATIEDDAGVEKEIKSNERYYVPCEITWLAGQAGFKKAEIFASKLGAYSRGDKLTTEDFEMLVVAEK
jgi:ubiquinone/menaquinone biosynthesis C-methylase UbiE